MTTPSSEIPTAESPGPVAPRGGHGLDLFLTGFLVLFLELACIRWFGNYVIFLQFFPNIVLMAAFLGMSLGCLAARSRADWLRRFPALLLLAVTLALAQFAVYQFWERLVVEVGNQADPETVYFGTETRSPDIAQFVVPIESIAGATFVLVALLFLGLGQVMGRAFAAYPHRVLGYTLNIGGSLLGILGFGGLAVLRLGPAWWFGISFLGMGYLMARHQRLAPVHVVCFVLAWVPIVAAGWPQQIEWRKWLAGEEYPPISLGWSPYYAIYYDRANGFLNTGMIAHQQMHDYETGAATYSLIHHLQRTTANPPYEDVLIIGAGSGNDVAHALRHGVQSIDAVEIDPIILKTGMEEHPERPYDDPRVTRHLDDGRHFLRTTERKYDLVVYALVDSLILHSSYGNLRLESYLFTREAFEDVRRVLKPDGRFVMYNYYRRAWIVHRAADLLGEVFGEPPIVLPLDPPRGAIDLTQRFPTPVLKPEDRLENMTVLIAGDVQGLREGFAEEGPFWLHIAPPVNDAVDGFDIGATQAISEGPGRWLPVLPARLERNEATPLPKTTDDWPFPYLRSRTVPWLNLRAVLLIGLLGLGMLAVWAPPGRWKLDSRMFFLGAAFLLLETKAVVQLALLFGSTWFVNSGVFFAILTMILLSNLFVILGPRWPLAVFYAGLVLSLVLNIFVPLSLFLEGGFVWRIVLPTALVMLPIFFAGIVFARSFAESTEPDWAFGSNIAGALVGGLAECLSLLLGFRWLLLVVIVLYLLSIPRWPRR